jgi:DNA-binding transcriptional LysR family regulator
MTELEVVLAVARRSSFRGAAQELGMSTTAVSSAVAGLEARLKVRLFNRSTRSVALTDIGQRYVERIAPALAQIKSADEEVSVGPDEPSGTLRINAPHGAAYLLLDPLLKQYAERYPEVRIDILSESSMVDIVAGGFDAGIRLAESVPQDMIAVALSGDIRMFVVATPEYLERHGVPEHPRDLLTHQSIGMRMAHGGLYHWELERDGQKLQMDLPVRFASQRVAGHQTGRVVGPWHRFHFRVVHPGRTGQRRPGAGADPVVSVVWRVEALLLGPSLRAGAIARAD